MTVHSSSNIRN